MNLSTLSKDVLAGLFTGYRVTKYRKYYSSSDWGCFLMFPLDSDLVDVYFLEHYANRNKTMLMCTPYFQIVKKQQYVVKVFFMIVCFNYKLGMLKAWFERVKWRYVWDTFGGFLLVMSLSVAVVITLSGVFCEWVFYTTFFFKKTFCEATAQTL